ncbi:YcgN family cysteine cluster protein [Aliidiomarina minuta]|uniref:YcgN family cysteine cluster protein n=1 Tax=Aliidiomarina minuta TaxID=880057 RepID=A0A432W814_9GAMM|nr:YcgN family cysteine cluster protein [Aliidiomarina minuta]RUO26169.1 YcgN family cysteine cluster protein [Aliidiomarina minuta]
MEFWESKSLSQMSDSEWESLCDGCGKCCLHKIIDSDEDEPEASEADLYMRADETLFYTDVRCRYLDPKNARCGCYTERLERVPDCVNITLADLPYIHFMPPSCAYRRLHEGKGLPSWHPLLHQGSQQAMRDAGMSVSNYVTFSDAEISEDDYGLRIVTWPLN